MLEDPNIIFSMASINIETDAETHQRDLL